MPNAKNEPFVGGDSLINHDIWILSFGIFIAKMTEMVCQLFLRHNHSRGDAMALLCGQFGWPEWNVKLGNLCFRTSHNDGAKRESLHTDQPL